jgi:nicotinamide-nucleotide amidase
MKAVIIIVGDEITSGHTPDTNSRYLISRLVDLGVSVYRMVAIGDDVDAISHELKSAVAAADLVLLTGGLGPTHDDRTKQAVAEALERTMILNPEIQAQAEQHLRKRKLYSAEVVEALATVPEGSEPLANPAGTAAGLLVTEGPVRIYLLPGVPPEMEAIFESRIAPELKAGVGGKSIKSRLIRTIGITESQITQKLAGVIPRLQTKLAFLPQRTGVDLRLTADASSEQAATRALDDAAGEIVSILEGHVYSTAGEELHQVTGKMLIERAKTIAIAESCTGGLIAHLLTQVAGISACLDRGIVAYSEQAKVDALGIDRDLIAEHGGVSREVARDMAVGIRRAAGTDLGLSTTGIAGPTGGSDSTPVGLVWIGLADGTRCQVVKKTFSGTRDMIKMRTAAHALEMIRCLLIETEE